VIYPAWFSCRGVQPVEVDGSQGEGGGQILRTAVAFAAIKQVPVRVEKIRAGRDVPGLKRQHLSALKVLASVFGGSLDGAHEGSTEVKFVPGRPKLRSLSTDMGTAASITLVLQAVIPAVALSGSALTISLTGGTDVPWSPTFDYFRRVVLGGYRALGVEAEVSATRRGYYPRGGGQVTAEIRSCPSLNPLTLTEAPQSRVASIVSRCGSLPQRVALRQAQAAKEVLGRSGVRVDGSDAAVEPSSSPGTSILVYAVGPGHFVGSDSIGARGKPAEAVGAEAAEKFVATLDTGAAVDANLADMILPLLSMAPGPSRVKVPAVTPHLESGMRIAEQFTPCEWSATEEGRSTVVSVRPRAV
jgi:RNA 3'-phosphate cyclase